MKTTVRIRYAKIGRAKYISHLDMLRCFQRCIRRADLPIAYSEGFHPHMQLILAAALSLGFESEGEVIEMQLAEDMPPETVLTKMQAILPEGISAIDCYVPVHKIGALGFAEYAVTLPCDAPETVLEQWEAFLSQPEILVEKKTKRGVREINLKEVTECLSASAEPEKISLYLRLPAGSTLNVNPSLLIDTFLKNHGEHCGFPQYRRIKLLTTEKTEFF